MPMRCENCCSAVAIDSVMVNPLFRAGASAAPSSVASPCVSVCRMDQRTGWCEGCWRTIDEIAAWSRLDDAGKHVVLKRVEERMVEAGGAGMADAGERA